MATRSVYESEGRTTTEKNGNSIERKKREKNARGAIYKRKNRESEDSRDKHRLKDR